MSFWDSYNQQVVRFDDKPIDNCPGWIWRDCGCSGGLQWSSGTEPIECGMCIDGFYAVHIKSGAMAAWPGGPFLGKEEPESEWYKEWKKKQHHG